jgi:hypothetical protein
MAVSSIVVRAPSHTVAYRVQHGMAADVRTVGGRRTAPCPGRPTGGKLCGEQLHQNRFAQWPVCRGQERSLGASAFW